MALLVPLMLIGCVANKTRDFPVTPFYAGHLTDAVTGEPLSDVLVHIATLRRLPNDAITVTTDADGRYLAGVLGHSAWSVTLAVPPNELCSARITFIRAGYTSQSQEDAALCSNAPKTLDVALTRSE